MKSKLRAFGSGFLGLVGAFAFGASIKFLAWVVAEGPFFPNVFDGLAFGLCGAAMFVYGALNVWKEVK